MKYKLLLLDIDGTLRPGSCERVPKENAEAVCAVQKAGVKIAIATGRGRIGVGKGLLRSIRPDYWVCAGGAQLVDYKGADLALHCLTTEEMYALVDFFEDYDLPLRFTYHDANYAYLGYEEFARREREKNLALNIVDGEDQDKHLEEMPFGAFGCRGPHRPRRRAPRHCRALPCALAGGVLNGRVHPCRPRSAAAARCAGQRADLRQLSQPQEPGAGLFLRPQAEPLLADDRRRDR